MAANWPLSYDLYTLPVANKSHYMTQISFQDLIKEITI